MMDELSLFDIFSILRRRRKYALVTAAVIFAVVLIGALRYSSYRSTATVQIEQSNVSSALATPNGANAGDVTEALADQRISQVEQTVTSVDSLNAIIDKFNMYPDARKTMSPAALASKMAKKIKLDFIGSTLSNPAEAEKASIEQLSAVAFTLSFDYSDPKITQAVTAELVNRFLEEDTAIRRRQAEDTSAFLQSQITDLETTMAGQEKKIADFRAQHGESGPAALAFNQQASSSTYLALQNNESQLSANQGTEGKLRAELATIDPYSRVIADGQVLTTPAIQLKALQSKYAALSSQYGPSHPDVVKVRHEMEALEAEQGGRSDDGQSGDTAGLKAMIQDVETNLAAAKSTGGENNPNVAALQHQLNKLQARLTATHARPSADKADADNPAYLQILAQIRSLDEQNRALQAEHATLMARQEKYQHAVAENPGIEQQMEGLSRDYDNEQVRYRELKEKKMAADMSEQLELGKQGQRLRLNVPANLPAHTHPAQLLIVAGGLVLSAVGGLLAVCIAEATSQNLYGAHQLAELTGAAPLVIIPRILTNTERNQARRLRQFGMVAVVAAILLGVILFPLIVMPYDVLWSSIAQKLNLS